MALDEIGGLGSPHILVTYHGKLVSSGRTERVAVGVLQVEYPEELLGSIGRAELEHLAREALLVKLYDLGKLSSGRAARILGITRREFLDTLGR